MPKRPPSSNKPSGSSAWADGPALAAQTLVALVRAYQLLVRPALPRTCRFAPSCSTYAIEAITQHGGIHGLGLTLRRVARCHPWHAGGYDPVPLEEG